MRAAKASAIAIAKDPGRRWHDHIENECRLLDRLFRTSWNKQTDSVQALFFECSWTTLRLDVCWSQVTNSWCCLQFCWWWKVRFHPWSNPRIRVVMQVLDLKLMRVPRNKKQDLIMNTQWNQTVKFPRRVLSWCCTFLQTCGDKRMSQWQNMRQHRAINLDNDMSILLDGNDECRANWAHCNSHKFLNVQNHICFVGEISG